MKLSLCYFVKPRLQQRHSADPVVGGKQSGEPRLCATSALREANNGSIDWAEE